MNTNPGIGERAFRNLLRLYPRAFRDEYTDDLLELFRHRRDQRLDTRGRLGFGFWRFIALDVAGSAIHEHWDARTAERRKGDGLRGWVSDFGYAARRLLRAPAFTAVALTILVLGVGVNTTAFSLVNALLLQEPPFPEPDRVVSLLQDSDDGRPNSTSYPAYLDIARHESLFEATAASSNGEAFLGQDDVLSSILVEYATAGYLNVIQLPLTRGRWFDITEDDPDGAPAAVLTHRFWRDRLASDPAVLGTTLQIGGAPVTVVGVGPEAYSGGRGPIATDLWLSISAMRATGGPAVFLDQRHSHPFTVLARLRDGITLAEVEVGMDRLAAELATTYPELNEGRRLNVIPAGGVRIDPSVDGQLLPVAALVMSVAALVLLIATLNLANLLLVRTTARAKELAVRLAIGAGRWRLVRVVLAEALLLSFMGGLGGLLAALWILRTLERVPMRLGVPLTLDVNADLSVLLFALGASVATGLVFGLIPALRATSRDANATLRDESATSLGGRSRFGMTGVLVAGQVGVSMLLLSLGSVFLESLLRAGQNDPGFAYEEAGFTQVSLQPLDLSPDEAALTYERIAEVAEGLPSVNEAAFSFQLPGAMFGSTTLLLGSGLGGVDSPTEIPWNLVGADFFDVMQVPLLHGRTFGPSDVGGAPVVVVSQAMAESYWGRSDVVGQLLRSENNPDSPSEIVGVVGDATVRSLGESPTPSLYWLYTAGAAGRGHMVFTANGPVSTAITDVRKAIQEVDPRILILRAGTFEDHLGDTLVRERLAARILSLLGGLALLLALLGVYGLVSYSVTRRRREVGIRMALGAGRTSVVRLFVKNVSMVVLLGAGLGFALSVPLVSFVGQTFVGRGGNPWLTGALALGLVVTALFATLIPAARAAGTDPKEALTWE